MLPLPLIGAITTVEVTVGGFIVAALIGLTCAILQGFRSRLLRAAVAIYVDVFRAVPILTQLFISASPRSASGSIPCRRRSSGSASTAAPI